MTNCLFHYTEHTCTDPDLLNDFIDTFSLALITRYADGCFISSHVPLLRNLDGTLFGHVDRRNPQFNNLDPFEAQLVFMGPDSYIPPEAYHTRQLPTWNYLAVHMRARVEIITNTASNLETLRKSAEQLTRNGSSYRVDSQDPVVGSNLGHIFGLLITPLHVEGRFKMSQDKSQEDQESALNWFLERQHDDRQFLIKHLINIFSPAAGRS